MSRLYLVLLFLVSLNCNGQNNLKKYLEFAKQQYDKGDYYYALEYYEKALDLDSQTIDILWNYAETLRAYKDYRRAEYYYAKVYSREEAKLFPYSLLYWGLMQKQNGKYPEALETFKKAKKRYYKDKKSYLYQKSKQEIQSTLWAQSALKDTLDVSIEPLPETVNTQNSEFGHGIYDGKLYFSSLRADSISAIEEVYTTNYHTNLFTSNLNNGSLEFEASEKIKELFTESLSTGNGVFSLDGSRFYFSKCEDQGYNYHCKIMVARYSNGKWTNIDSLGDLINEGNSNTTMPAIANLNGSEVLFFAADREEGEGGLDIYYSTIKNGNQFSKARPLKAANSPDNDVTPWWDSIAKRLYFASSWHNGFGGHDVFYIPYNGQFGEAANAGLPINSPANDLYYFKYADTSLVTSNRLGVMFSKNPTCCSDIFALKPPIQPEPPTTEETLFELNKRLPVTLYFHNDRPDPDSQSTTTKLNYIETYESYTALLDEYKKEYSNGLSGEKAEEAKEDIETFFIEYVDKGVSDLEHFRDLLLKELEKGVKVEITIKGFASPLAKTDYNVNLTKRRISSLMNYLRVYNNGVFVPYLDNYAPNGGRVVFQEVPFGEYTANQLTSDNPNDVQNSVYSRAAAIERKIEIQSVNYLEENQEFPLKVESPVHDAGVIAKGTPINAVFTIENRANKVVKLGELRIPCDCTKATMVKNQLQPGEKTVVNMTLDTKELNGFEVKSIYLSVEGVQGELRLYITTQVQ